MTDKSPTREWVNTLVSAFSGQQNILTIPRAYIEVTGNIEDALLLSQIIYWSDRTTMDDGWFAKSYAEWQNEIALSKYQVMAAVKRLKDAGVETIVKKFKGYPTVHYRLRKSDFEQWIVKKLDERKLRNLTNDSKETERSSTETTTETTAKPVSRKKRERDPLWDAIAELWDTTASGQIAVMRSMFLGIAKRGEWKTCNFELPATAEEITRFGRYAKRRVIEAHIPQLPTSPITIQRWFYDFRRAEQSRLAPPTSLDNIIGATPPDIEIIPPLMRSDPLDHNSPPIVYTEEDYNHDFRADWLKEHERRE